MSNEYFEIHKSDKGEYWWRLKDANHKSIGWSGETYKSKPHTIKMAEQVRDLLPRTLIKDETGE